MFAIYVGDIFVTIYFDKTQVFNSSDSSQLDIFWRYMLTIYFDDIFRWTIYCRRYIVDDILSTIYVDDIFWRYIGKVEGTRMEQSVVIGNCSMEFGSNFNDILCWYIVDDIFWRYIVDDIFWQHIVDDVFWQYILTIYFDDILLTIYFDDIFWPYTLTIYFEADFLSLHLIIFWFTFTFIESAAVI